MIAAHLIQNLISWPKELISKRMVGSNCQILYDFDWIQIIGHKYPKFPGIQDLTYSIEKHAQNSMLLPLLILTDLPEHIFEEKFVDEYYIAIINIIEFLNYTSEHDRSALFFLSIISKNSPISAASLFAKNPENAEILKKALEYNLSNESTLFIDTIAKGGSKLTCSLLNVALKALDRHIETADLEILSSALETSSASLVANMSATVRRRAAVDKLEQLLTIESKEHEFQKWFEENPWVLGTNCVRILDARAIDVKNIADYIVEALDGRADIIEIKKPALPFWNKKKDHDNYIPHPDLVESFIQAQNYQFALEGEMNSIKTRKILNGIPIAKPSSLLIYGRSNEWNDDQFEAQRLLNSGFTNLCIITYDQVLLRSRTLLG